MSSDLFSEAVSSAHAAEPAGILEDVGTFVRRFVSLTDEQLIAISLWVVPSDAITASSPSESGPFFDPGADKAYRHPQFYKVPRGVRGV